MTTESNLIFAYIIRVYSKFKHSLLTSRQKTCSLITNTKHLETRETSVFKEENICLRTLQRKVKVLQFDVENKY